MITNAYLFTLGISFITTSVFHTMWRSEKKKFSGADDAGDTFTPYEVEANASSNIETVNNLTALKGSDSGLSRDAREHFALDLIDILDNTLVNLQPYLGSGKELEFNVLLSDSLYIIERHGFFDQNKKVYFNLSKEILNDLTQGNHSQINSTELFYEFLIALKDVLRLHLFLVKHSNSKFNRPPRELNGRYTKGMANWRETPKNYLEDQMLTPAICHRPTDTRIVFFLSFLFNEHHPMMLDGAIEIRNNLSSMEISGRETTLFTDNLLKFFVPVINSNQKLNRLNIDSLL